MVQFENRRARALKRLEAQLLAGTKPEKVNGKTTTNLIALSKEDKTRIEREIGYLKQAPKKKGIKRQLPAPSADQNNKTLVGHRK